MFIIGITLVMLFLFGTFAVHGSGVALANYDRFSAGVFLIAGLVMQVGAVASAIVLATGA